MKRNYISPELLYTQMLAEDIVTGSSGSDFIPTKPSIVNQADGGADYFEFPG